MEALGIHCVMPLQKKRTSSDDGDLKDALYRMPLQKKHSFDDDRWLMRIHINNNLICKLSPSCVHAPFQLCYSAPVQRCNNCTGLHVAKNNFSRNRALTYQPQALVARMKDTPVIQSAWLNAKTQHSPWFCIMDAKQQVSSSLWAGSSACEVVGLAR